MRPCVAAFVDAPADDRWNPLLLQVVTRTLLPLAAMVSVYLLLRGHNLPGGGFIAGLVLAAAVMIVRVAGGGVRGRRQWFAEPDGGRSVLQEGFEGCEAAGEQYGAAYAECGLAFCWIMVERIDLARPLREHMEARARSIRSTMIQQKASPHSA